MDKIVEAALRYNDAKAALVAAREELERLTGMTVVAGLPTPPQPAEAPVREKKKPGKATARAALNTKSVETHDDKADRAELGARTSANIDKVLAALEGKRLKSGDIIEQTGMPASTVYAVLAKLKASKRVDVDSDGYGVAA